MKEVFTHADSARVGLFKSLLDEAGIACFIRNESGNLIAGVPVQIFYPVLCIINDADFDRAKVIVNSQGEVLEGGEWVCPKCKSLNPSGFGRCWSCETEYDSKA